VQTEVGQNHTLHSDERLKNLSFLNGQWSFIIWRLQAIGLFCAKAGYSRPLKSPLLQFGPKKMTIDN
jgi:hypothetical protein